MKKKNEKPPPAEEGSAVVEIRGSSPCDILYASITREAAASAAAVTATKVTTTAIAALQNGCCQVSFESPRHSRRSRRATGQQSLSARPTKTAAAAATRGGEHNRLVDPWGKKHYPNERKAAREDIDRDKEGADLSVSTIAAAPPPPLPLSPPPPPPPPTADQLNDPVFRAKAKARARAAKADKTVTAGSNFTPAMPFVGRLVAKEKEQQPRVCGGGSAIPPMRPPQRSKSSEGWLSSRRRDWGLGEDGQTTRNAAAPSKRRLARSASTPVASPATTSPPCIFDEERQGGEKLDDSRTKNSTARAKYLAGNAKSASSSEKCRSTVVLRGQGEGGGRAESGRGASGSREKHKGITACSSKKRVHRSAAADEHSEQGIQEVRPPSMKKHCGSSRGKKGKGVIRHPDLDAPLPYRGVNRAVDSVPLPPLPPDVRHSSTNRRASTKISSPAKGQPRERRVMTGKQLHDTVTTMAADDATAGIGATNLTRRELHRNGRRGQEMVRQAGAAARSTSEKQAAATTGPSAVRRTAVARIGNTTFAGLGLVLTGFHEKKTRELERAIRQGGGRVLEGIPLQRTPEQSFCGRRFKVHTETSRTRGHPAVTGAAPAVAPAVKLGTTMNGGDVMVEKTDNLVVVAVSHPAGSRLLGYMLALATGTPLVHHFWVSDSLAQGQALPAASYLLPGVRATSRRRQAEAARAARTRVAAVQQGKSMP